MNSVAPPPQVSEAVLDHDYTILALKRYSEGVREFWTYTLRGMKKVEGSLVEPIKSFLHNDLRQLKVWFCPLRISMGVLTVTIGGPQNTRPFAEIL